MVSRIGRLKLCVSRVGPVVLTAAAPITYGDARSTAPVTCRHTKSHSSPILAAAIISKKSGRDGAMHRQVEAVRRSDARLARARPKRRRGGGGQGVGRTLCWLRRELSSHASQRGCAHNSWRTTHFSRIDPPLSQPHASRAPNSTSKCTVGALLCRPCRRPEHTGSQAASRRCGFKHTPRCASDQPTQECDAVRF